MDEKTEELRDIFMDVAEEGTVTESQAESPGSLAADAEGAEERLAAVVERMRERFDFETELDDDALVAVVQGFYTGADDAAIADDLGVDPEDVFTARLDLHLLGDDAPVDLDRLRDLLGETDSEGAAAELDVSVEAAERGRRVLAARSEARRVSHRFRSEFEDVFADAGLSATMTESIREDGLWEATEDIDSLDSDADVSF